MARFALISYHTSPLAQPGTGDGGGMNVYVRELGAALARSGHDVDIYTRRESATQPSDVTLEPGLSVFHLTAGPFRDLVRDELPLHLEAFTTQLRDHLLIRRPDVLHANYWLSGVVAHDLKHELQIPLVTTFHTCQRIKGATAGFESSERDSAEVKLFECSDAILASCDVEARQFEEHYNADAHKIFEVPLGTEHAFFSPGFRPQARRALGLDPGATWLLFVGRIQELKGPRTALETLIELRRRGHDAHLAVVGGPSGPTGQVTLDEMRQRARETGVNTFVHYVAPQSHQLLSTWMRAADVTLVPSFSESFGLAALESSACGTPVVASAVGGLTSIVRDGVNGYLVEGRDPADYADAVERAIDPARSLSMSNQAVLLARQYTWRDAARRVIDISTRLEQPVLTC